MSKRVLIGLSGGVDSAVSAARLVDAGYEVTAVYLRAWDEALAPFLEGMCPWQDDIADARRVAAALSIPFTVIDVRAAYERRVIEVMEAEYAAGRTPNPDILCNREMKFGLLYDLMIESRFDFLATGHYASIESKQGDFSLHRAIDSRKDQTYFLWALRKEQLARILFPLGQSTKREVRIEATRRGLPVAAKKDSQGICFLGPVSLRAYLAKRLKTQSGPVVDTTGRIVGEHEGAALYTLGQRHGLGLMGGEGESLYVTERSIATNTLVVDRQAPETNTLNAHTLHWIDEPPQPGERFEARIRHGQAPQRCAVVRTTQGSIEIRFEKPQTAVAPGQSVVFSTHSQIRGGGIIG